MRILPSILAAIAAALLLAAPCTVQPRMSACEAAAPGLPLVETVTEADTGRPLSGAIVIVGRTNSAGCYTVIGADEIMGGVR